MIEVVLNPSEKVTIRPHTTLKEHKVLTVQCNAERVCVLLNADEAREVARALTGGKVNGTPNDL
jgi:hypothetical protein